VRDTRSSFLNSSLLGLGQALVAGVHGEDELKGCANAIWAEGDEGKDFYEFGAEVGWRGAGFDKSV